MDNQRVLINLPERIPFKLNDIDRGDSNEEDLKLINHLKEFIEEHIFTWILPLNNFYNFNLPETLFKENTNISYGNFGNMEVDYNENELVLSSKQLSEIWKRGEFSVESKITGLPYVWKLSEWTV